MRVAKKRPGSKRASKGTVRVAKFLVVWQSNTVPRSKHNLLGSRACGAILSHIHPAISRLPRVAFVAYRCSSSVRKQDLDRGTCLSRTTCLAQWPCQSTSVAKAMRLATTQNLRVPASVSTSWSKSGLARSFQLYRHDAYRCPKDPHCHYT